MEIRPPVPGTSSSGCAATMTALRASASADRPVPSSPAPSSVLSHGQAAQDRSSVPGASIGCAPEVRLTRSPRARRPAGRAVPGRARHGAGVGRPSGLRPRGSAPRRGRAARPPSARPVLVRTSVAAASVSARTRIARRGPSPRSSPGSVSISSAAWLSAAHTVRSARSTAPRCASACGLTSRLDAADSSARATSRAPPYQQAATPTPPWLNPGLFVYASIAPTGMAATPGKPTSSVSLPAMPVAGQLSGFGSSSPVETANSRAPSAAAAVTRTSVQVLAPEQYCLVPCSSQNAVPPGRLHVRTGRVRRPHTPAAARLWARSPQFGQDRHRVGVSFGQPGQRQVLPGQIRECGPPFPGRA